MYESLVQAQQIAERFARLLDYDDFDAAEALLDEACVYAFRGQELLGRAAIMAPYRVNGAKAKLRFDSVGYHSSVHADGPTTATIEFVDELGKAGHTHVYRCAQRLDVNDQGQIVRIEHIELEGERERLQAFCANHSIILD